MDYNNPFRKSDSIIDAVRHVLSGKGNLEEKKKLDPVDKDELKGDHDERDDKDIDNDGDVDSSDEYLHKRRKAIAKAMKNEGSCNTKKESEDEYDDNGDEKKKKKVGAKKDEIDTEPSMADAPMVAEKEMSDAQMKKREEIVKSMKKKMPDFKKKYGERAKDVMYATATKMAMKEGFELGIEKADLIEEVEQVDEISRDTVRSYIKKASAHKTTGEKPKKDRTSGVELAGKKAYGIGGKAKVSATEEAELDEAMDTFTVKYKSRSGKEGSMKVKARDKEEAKAKARRQINNLSAINSVNQIDEIARSMTPMRDRFGKSEYEKEGEKDQFGAKTTKHKLKMKTKKGSTKPAFEETDLDESKIETMMARLDSLEKKKNLSPTEKKELSDLQSKLKNMKEETELDEGQKPYVSVDRDGNHVLDAAGKIVKTFKDMESANAYLKKNYNKLREETELDEKMEITGYHFLHGLKGQNMKMYNGYKTKKDAEIAAKKIISKKGGTAEIYANMFDPNGRRGHQDYPKLLKSIKEEVEQVDEKRGRPAKDEEGGREHIQMQLRKAQSLGSKELEFENGDKLNVNRATAAKADVKLQMIRRPGDRQDMINQISKSAEAFNNFVK